jgi:hypothetical protein
MEMKMNREVFRCFAMFSMSLIGLVSCQGTGKTDLYLGMPKDELTAKYGPPIRIETDSSGGEEWYYRTGIRETVIETESTPDPDLTDEWRRAGGDTDYSSSITMKWEKKYRELPVSISPDGKVDGIPNGKLEKSPQ